MKANICKKTSNHSKGESQNSSYVYRFSLNRMMPRDYTAIERVKLKEYEKKVLSNLDPSTVHYLNV